MRYFLHFVLMILVGAAITVGIAGLRGRPSRRPPLEVFPDMDRQLKLRPMQPNDFFPNGTSSQLPPPGTIARSEAFLTRNGPGYSFEDIPANTGCVTGTTNFVETNPLPVTGKLLAHGREGFDIYCAPCHGALGDGDGITKKLGVMPTVANLHEKRLVEMSDGEIFNTITHGKGTMAAAGPLLMIAGAVVSAIGAALNPAEFGCSWLLAFMFFLSLSLGALFLVMLHHLSDAGWSVATRRACEHIAALLFPWLAILFLPVAIFAKHIYSWMTIADPHSATQYAHAGCGFIRDGELSPLP